MGIMVFRVAYICSGVSNNGLGVIKGKMGQEGQYLHNGNVRGGIKIQNNT